MSSNAQIDGDGGGPEGLMASCAFEELVSRVAAMLKESAPPADINRFLEMLSPEYRAEVIASAKELVEVSRPKQ
jgi:hypothetical protein